MSETLLRTKLFVPPSRPDLVSRPRLIDRLNRGLYLGHKLTLISAPAGFGKTTLVAEWLHSSSFAWLSLDVNDNDPALFLAYLIAALEEIHDGIGRRALALLQSSQRPPLETIMTTLINEIAVLSTSLIFVLDDYHLIQAQPIHGILTFLLDHQPTQLHLVIITRADPLLPLARYRARRQMTEMRETDLRFTPGEAAIFLNQIMGLALTQEQVEALASRTEGWIAGLQMAALSMQNLDDIPGFIRSFSGSHRFILDFLTDEVLRQRPAGTRDFLLQTSVLDRLCGPLCDAVTGQRSGQATLELLEQAGLFIIPLDQSRQWYRYHHLYSELLRYRLRVQGDPPESLLHQRASQWYERNGFLAEAISHALAADDWEIGATLIEQASDDMLKRGQVDTLIDWCQQLPAASLRVQPDLGISFAWALLLAGRFDDVGELLDELETLAGETPTLLGQVATAQAYLARAKGDHAQVIEKSEKALALLPDDELVHRGTVALNLGLVYWHTGRLLEAEPALLEASVTAGRSGNYFGQVAARVFLARTLASRGKLSQAKVMVEEILGGRAQVPILALAHFDLAALYYEWDELEQAGEQVREGMELIGPSGNVEFQYAGHLLRAVLLLAMRDYDGAWREAGSAHELAQELDPVAQARSAALHVQAALALGDLDTAVHWSSQRLEGVDAHPFYRFLGLTRPRLLLALGQREAAALQLESCYETASQAGWGYGMIATRVWQALAAEAPESALAFLSEVLRLAAPEGYIRTFVDAGEPLAPLLREMAAQGIMLDYVGRILSGMADRQAVEPTPVKPGLSPLVEPLTEREMEILRLLAERQTNAEIALALSVSVNTVKTHLQHIYEKLGVHDRRAAAASASNLSLL